MRTDFHIVVIGGGIVGACAAALAAADPALAKLRIGLIEARLPTAPPPDADLDIRVSALSRASERILDSFGAWDAVPAHMRSSYRDMVVWDSAGKPHGAGSIHFSASSSTEPDLGHIVENRSLLWAIYASPAFRERVTVLNAGLSRLELGAERVELELSDGRALSSRLVVGSDGSDSASRTLAGIDSARHDYPQAAFVTHVRTEHAHRRTAWQRFLPAGPIAFLPLADGRSSIVWTTTPSQAQSCVNEPADKLEAKLCEALDGALGQVTLAGPRGAFPLRMQHARNYCAERFALIGDAAHTVHPLAGQGVNLGLLDAAALIETLSAARAAGANEQSFCERRVLRRYERWRKSENALALGFIDALNRLFASESGVLGAARRIGLDALDGSAAAKRFFMSRAMATAGDLPALAKADPAR